MTDSNAQHASLNTKISRSQLPPNFQIPSNATVENNSSASSSLWNSDNFKHVLPQNAQSQQVAANQTSAIGIKQEDKTAVKSSQRPPTAPAATPSSANLFSKYYNLPPNTAIKTESSSISSSIQNLKQLNVAKMDPKNIKTENHNKTQTHTITSPPPLMPVPSSLNSNSSVQTTHFSASFPKLNQPAIFPQINFQNLPISAAEEENKRKRALEEAQEREDPVKRRVVAAAAADRHRVMHPDYITQFVSHEDAWQRLLSYHLFHVPSAPPNPKTEEKWMEQYAKMAKGYLERFEKIRSNYNSTVVKLAERHPKEEQILLDKLSYYEEKVAFDNTKARAAAALQQARQAASGTSTVRTATTPQQTTTATGSLVKPMTGTPFSSPPLKTTLGPVTTPGLVGLTPLKSTIPATVTPLKTTLATTITPLKAVGPTTLMPGTAVSTPLRTPTVPQVIGTPLQPSRTSISTLPVVQQQLQPRPQLQPQQPQLQQPQPQQPRPQPGSGTPNNMTVTVKVEDKPKTTPG